MSDNSKNVRWATVLERARDIVNSYETPITLRQLFYRLVVAALLPNTQNYYRTLSSRSAEARREGAFPDLLDQRGFHRQTRSFPGVGDAYNYAHRIFRLDAPKGSPTSSGSAGRRPPCWASWTTGSLISGSTSRWAGASTPRPLVTAWPERWTRMDGNRSCSIYGGDFDPSREDILRDLQERTGCFDLTTWSGWPSTWTRRWTWACP